MGESESTSAIKRTIEQGGVEVNGKKDYRTSATLLTFAKGDVIKIWKEKVL